MHFKHHDVEYSLPDEWWNEAGMQTEALSGRSYLGGLSPSPGLAIFEVAINDVEPVVRQASHGVFNDSNEFGKAHDRVVRILRGFREQSPIPPIKVSRLPSALPPRYKLIDGTHRLYCAIAAGFSHVPAVEVDDFFGTYP